MNFNCGKCKKKFRIPEEQTAGKETLKVRCPHCKTVNRLSLGPKKPTFGETMVLEERHQDFSFLQQQDYEVPPGTPMRGDQRAVAWLIVHTEGRDHEAFPLFVGDNVIGRKSRSGTADIALDGDPYVSRLHCNVEVLQTPKALSFIISDNGSHNNGNPSTNGTFVNGVEDRLTSYDEVYIADGDTVQIGRTKLVLRIIKKDPLHTVVNEVSGSNYLKTVVE